MKLFLVSILLFLSAGIAAQSIKSKRIYLQKGGDNGILLPSDKISYSPGDTLVLKASDNPFSYVYLGNFSGTAKNPVVVINEGGQVVLTQGFDIENGKYVKVTGSGSKERYGFLIQHSPQPGLNIHARSAHVEAERFYVEDGAFGCWIKNEANCDTTINSWVLDDISVHDFEMHHIKIEGFYMGSTDPNNASRPITCNNVKQYYKPSKLGNIKIYNGIIDGTGRPAIQLSNAAIGMSEIYNNKVSNVGRENNDQQGTGISLGLYTRAYVHNNTIKNTLTWGIASLGGSGLIRIENNKIDSSGYLDDKVTSWAQNILLDTRNTEPVDTTRFIIVNNSLGYAGNGAENINISRSSPTYSTNNIICNNNSNGKAAIAKIDPRVKWHSCGTAASGQKRSSGYRGYLLAGLGIFLSAVLIFFLVKNKTTVSFHSQVSL